ncbi:hypothetical protein G6011_05970 [Alternaria panax]|uniref:Uncharacterized protein n=1 Tax=Alternaria panax TaxID=48097 RepID=A0AAD4I7T1_9PLEO|nr:hypothetical protein G6011_05970 [Alternaria panax]
MSSSGFSDTTSVVSNESDVSIIDNIEEPEDFVVVSPACYSNPHVAGHSAHSPSIAASDQTAMVEYSKEKQKLLEKVSNTLVKTRSHSTSRSKGREHVADVETCRYHLRFSNCGMDCNGPIKCDDCISLVGGLETLANCAREWSNDSRSFRENVSKILHRLHGLPFLFQLGLYSVIDTLVEDWPVADQKNFELWGFKVSAVLWLLRIGVRGLTGGLQEGREWRLLLLEAERAWYQERVVAEEYEDAVEDIQRFANVFRKWGVDVGIQWRAQSST